MKLQNHLKKGPVIKNTGIKQILIQEDHKINFSLLELKIIEKKINKI